MFQGEMGCSLPLEFNLSEKKYRVAFVLIAYFNFFSVPTTWKKVFQDFTIAFHCFSPQVFSINKANT